MFNSVVFWAVVPAACGAVVGGVIVLLAYVYLLRPDDRRVKVVETKLNAMLSDLDKMVKHLDGLPKAGSAAREPFELGRAAMAAFKWDEAIAHFREAMKEAEGTQLAALFNLIGLCQYASDRPVDALRDYEESARLAEEFGDRQGKAADLSNIGNIYSAKGERDKALKYYEEALVIHREIAHQPGVANQLGNIGLIYNAKGEPDKALTYHEEALAIHREIGYQRGVANQLGKIGGIYSARGELDKALKHHEEALAIDREIGYERGVATDLGNIGLIYSAKGEPDKALKHYDEALVIDRAIGYQPGVANQLGRIGLVYSAKGEPDKALMYGVESLASYREIAYQPGVASALGNVGNAYVRTMQTRTSTTSLVNHNDQVDALAKNAIEYLVPALGMLLEMGIADGPKQCMWGLRECLKVLGRERFVAECVRVGMSKKQAEGLVEERPEATG